MPFSIARKGQHQLFIAYVRSIRRRLHLQMYFLKPRRETVESQNPVLPVDDYLVAVVH